MKKFAITCSFGGVNSPFTVYIGSPEKDHHPLHFQAEWLSKERGGTIPSEVMESVVKLRQLAEKNNVSFEELCTYALQAASGAALPEEQKAESGKEAAKEV
jgi:hypothetical protein